MSNFDEYDDSNKRYNFQEQEAIAFSYFNATNLTGEVKSKAIPGSGIESHYFAQVFEGGNSVIVDSHGNSLFAKNGITPKSHLEAFMKGKRTRAPYFNSPQTEQKSVPKQEPVKASKPAQKRPQQQTNDDKYRIDPKTGIKYKQLPGASKELVDASKKDPKSITLDVMMRTTEIDNDFDLDDLAKTADLFMGHLRVPVSKEEQAALKQERIDRQRAKEQARQAALSAVEAKEGKEQQEVTEDSFTSNLKF